MVTPSAVTCRKSKQAPPLIGENLRKVVFVLSTGRTGTMAIAKYISTAYRDVTALHEPKPSYQLRCASNASWAGHLSERQMKWILVHARKKLCEQLVDPVYVEANPYLWRFVNVLPSVVHLPLIVHVVRDPRSYVRSGLNFEAGNALKKAARTLIPFWEGKRSVPANLRYGTSPGSGTNRMELYAWGWRIVNENIETAAPLFGENYIRIRFEDLFYSSGNEFRRLGNWIGLEEIPGMLNPLMEHKINASYKQELPQWQSWTNDERDVIEHHCRELMTRYGYS